MDGLPTQPDAQTGAAPCFIHKAPRAEEGRQLFPIAAVKDCINRLLESTAALRFDEYQRIGSISGGVFTRLISAPNKAPGAV